jgi:hypothetical protein
VASFACQVRKSTNKRMICCVPAPIRVNKKQCARACKLVYCLILAMRQKSKANRIKISNLCHFVFVSRLFSLTIFFNYKVIKKRKTVYSANRLKTEPKSVGIHFVLLGLSVCANNYARIRHWSHLNCDPHSHLNQYFLVQQTGVSLNSTHKGKNNI